MDFIRLIWRRCILYNGFLLGFLGIYNRLFRPVELIALIVWPPANHLVTDIRDRLDRLCGVDSHVRVLISKGSIGEVIREVYKVDYASTAKIKYKIEDNIRR